MSHGAHNIQHTTRTDRAGKIDTRGWGHANGGVMARGPSGRVVVEASPELKRRLHSRLVANGRSLKDWFLEHANAYLGAETKRTAPPAVVDPQSRKPQRPSRCAQAGAADDAASHQAARRDHHLQDHGRRPLDEHRARVDTPTRPVPPGPSLPDPLSEAAGPSGPRLPPAAGRGVRRWRLLARGRLEGARLPVDGGAVRPPRRLLDHEDPVERGARSSGKRGTGRSRVEGHWVWASE